MEEWVGQKWHHFITQKSSFKYPKMRVKLVDIEKQLGVFFRAMGGDAGMSLGHTSALPYQSHRHWLQKLSGTGKKAELGHLSVDHFYLPEQLDCFPEKALNEDLYFWLSAMASFNHSPRIDQVIEHNQLLTRKVLKTWPGMKSIYRRLAKAQLSQRPDLKSLPNSFQNTESIIQKVLLNPFIADVLSYNPGDMPQPVIIWLRAIGDDSEKRLNQINNDSRNEAQGAESATETDHNKKSKRYQAEQVDDNDNKDGFMSFRLESMFSWSEFIDLDRSEEDGEDEDAYSVAEDLDKLSVNQAESGNKVRFDLDLPSSEYDDEIISGDILLPEWDYKKNQFLEDHCSLQLMALKLTEKACWSASLRQQANLLKRQFQALTPICLWHNRQADGDEIDLNAYIDFNSSRSLNLHQGESLLYRQRKKQNRDLSTLILTDLSLSTDAHVNDEKKVIDVIKEALYLLSESLHAAGEHFSIAGFTSKKRSHVRYYNIKSFDHSFDENCQDQIHAIKPAYYTRMGTAIRYATKQLKKQASKQKLLLILTDGKPNDLDKYESRYGLEDTKKSISEAKQQGLTPFCVSIDFEASDYLPYLFGNQGFIHLNNALDLPKKLPKLFFQLVG